MQDPQELDAASRAVVQEELTRRYFTPKVLSVTTVQERFGVVNWDVLTDKGQKKFVVRNMRDNTYSLGPGRLMMTDTDGNRYEWPDVHSYGPKAFAVLSKVI